MKNLKYVVAGAVILFPILAYAQQGQLSAVHQPGEHLRYTVTFSDGDVDKITAVSVALSGSGSTHPDQPSGNNRIGGDCRKSPDPKVWNCDVVIGQNVIDGDYRLVFLQAVGPQPADFYRNYDGPFEVPTVRIENPNKFTPPSKVTVKQQP